MIEKRFVYTGNAVGAAARITRIDPEKNLDHNVASLAPSCLSVIGGLSEGKAENFCFSVDKPKKLSVLSVKSAYTRALGKPDGNGFSTHVEATVHGFSVLDQLHVDLITAGLDSHHGPNDKVPSIRARGNQIQGLRLGDYALEVVLDEKLFTECGTKEELARAFASNKDLRGKYAWRFSAEGNAAEIPQTHNGYYVCSLVRDIKWVKKAHPDVTIEGYRLVWKGFGRIYLGEILVGDAVRRLTMVRAEMGSPVDGTATAGSVDNNGSSMP